ncbi:Crp/Fnr family transcriptional regulator [Bacillus solimangrovi]|uniref:Crp/Fnr family transcriptional regulator n=1 Tax=Bacillus solimangrovi TaxID=1305675 RepID=A0A1E5LC45_9BACI|nr:Crp/Fnr family transcriptional regulator [Bacillus solimangrovi]OEH91646.1 Crp/Fnr family transcriptional regulator [Bacillus solimangrovi]
MTQQAIRTLLKSIPLFRELTDEEIEPVLSIVQTREYVSGEFIFMQGETLENVYFILDGKVKIFKNDIQGKEQLVAVLQNGDMFPHAGFFQKGMPYPAHAESTEATTLVVLKVAQFENILMHSPQLSIKVFRMMGSKIVELQKRLEEQILNNSYEQILQLLIRLAESHGTEINENSYELTTQFTNQELANMIGASRETVSRTLTKLKKRNLIDVSKRGTLRLKLSLLKEECL